MLKANPLAHDVGWGRNFGQLFISAPRRPTP